MSGIDPGPYDQKEDAMRREMVRLARKCRQLIEGADSKGTTHILLSQDEAECVLRLAECVEAMDKWLQYGNPLPLAWLNDGTAPWLQNDE